MKTALRQSVASVKVLSVLVLVFLVLSVRYPSGYTIVPLVLGALYLAADVYNIMAIRRAAAKDPSYLDKRIN